MRYYEVFVASRGYHGRAALTYHNPAEIPPGTLVKVPLQTQVVIGVIHRRIPKPSFLTKVIAEIFPLSPLPPHVLDLIEWLSTYYPAPISTIVQNFIPRQLVIPFAREALPQPINTTSNLKALPKLTGEQQQAVGRITRQPGTYLLHGVTGSGKTRVYQELIQAAVSQGHSVIILTPEISLTTQLVINLQQNSIAPVVVMHSQLTDSARRTLWLQLLGAKNPVIVVGARSALFAPLKNLGLIVVDEAHEPAYKQEGSPHYQTLRVASKLSQLTGATLVFGSATPTLADYFWAEQKNIPILKMRQSPAGNASNRIIRIIDLRDKSLFSKSKYLSDMLIQSISATLKKSQQVLLFLNRRGSARVILCQNCGWQALCPNCDIPLIYHGDNHAVKCHLCNYSQAAPSACPVCGSTDILFKGVGTKYIVEEVCRLFPKARVQRFDSDNKKSERFEAHYKHAVSGDIDILVGTQTIAKGLDLPKLGLVGVIIADTSLYSPDYTATERLYQLISQVVGRVGRGHSDGAAIIQTYMPDSPLLRAAVDQNWDSFYQLELAERQRFVYPPFCHLLKLTCRRASPAHARKACVDFLATLQARSLGITVLGPAPAFHEKIGRHYCWQLVVKSRNRQQLLEVINLLPSGWLYDIDPVNLL